MISNEYQVLAAVGKTGGYLHVRRDGMDVRGERDVQAFAYKILDSEAFTLHADSDLFAPYFSESTEEQRERTVIGGLNSLVSFLLACAEARDEDDENYNLFPRKIREWAEQNSDELTMLASELDAMLYPNSL